MNLNKPYIIIYGVFMKKLFTILVVLAILPLSAMAQRFAQPETSQPNPYLDRQIKPSEVEVPFYLNNPKVEDPQAFTRIGSVQDNVFSLASRINPIRYEPFSGALLTAFDFRQSGTSGLDGMIYLLSSTNMGKNWSTAKEIYKKNGYVPVHLSFAVVNPTESKDPNQFKYMFYCPFAKYNPSTQTYPWGGGLYVYASPDEIADFDYWGPDDNNMANNRWWTGKTASFDDPDAQYTYHAGSLIPQTGAVAGSYGIGGFEMSNDYWDVGISKIPPQWIPSKFRQDADLTRTYNGPMSIDVDPQGNVYAALNNFFISDINNRVPGVSVSTDNGKTWSEFQTMPVTVLNNYITAYGGNPTGQRVALPGSIPYQQDAFVVTGVDEFSYIYRLYIWKDGVDMPELHIVEAYKKAGNWGIRKIADFKGIPAQIFLWSDATATDYREVYDDAELGNEIQVARTASGDAIVVKWLDYNTDITPVTINPEVHVWLTGVNSTGETVWARDTIREMLPTDVFSSYRNLTDNSWHVPLNITNDAVYYKTTHIPPVVPDLENIPIIMSRTIKFNYQATALAARRNNYPEAVQQMFIDYPQDIVYGKYNAKTGADVKNPELSYSFTLDNAFPNPANGLVEIPFSLDIPANVKIELFDAMGRQIDVIYQGAVDAGIHGVNYNTSNVSSGVYYYKMTVAEKSLTKMLSVVK